MKVSKLILCLFVLVQLIPSDGLGQVYYRLGLSLPQSDFSSAGVDGTIVGGAGTGVVTGVLYLHPIHDGNFGMYGSIDFSINWLQSAMKNYLDEQFTQLARGIRITGVKYYKYLNIPFKAGLSYSLRSDETIALFWNAGLIVNILKITDMKAGIGPSGYTGSFKPAAGAGLDLGGGLRINDKTTIGFDYMAMGNFNITGEFDGPGIQETRNTVLQVNLIYLTVGFRL